ncbi:MAG: hypothetical protein ACLFM0_02680 [Spirochaetales bacterium]
MDGMLFSATDWIGIVLGFLLIGGVLAIASLLHRAGLDTFVTRKVVHIGVGHWWLVAWYFHDAVAPALVGPIVFTIANYVFYRRNRIEALGHAGAKGNFGIVLYPVSLIALVLLSWMGPLSIHAAAAGVLIMAWGDGLAAIVGRALSGRTTARLAAEPSGRSASPEGSHRSVVRPGSGGKTLAGSLAMFISSVLVVLVVAGVAVSIPPLRLAAAAAVVAGAATVAERFTPWSIDNLSVPLVAALSYARILG